jgi:hypothetical protein
MIGGIIAYTAVVHARAQAKTRNAIDFVNDVEFNEGYQDAWGVFRRCCDENLLEEMVKDIPQHLSDIRCIDRVLNYYEQISYGYLSGVFDRAYLRMWFSGQLTPDVDCTLNYIRHFRSRDNRYGDHETFTNLLALYFIWGGDNLDLDERIQITELYGAKVSEWRETFLWDSQRPTHVTY